MNLTLGQKLMFGVSLVIAMLLAASVRMSCIDGRAGSIHVSAKRSKGNESGKIRAHKYKSQHRGADSLSRNRRR